MPNSSSRSRILIQNFASEGESIYPLQRITHNDHVLVLKDMPLDSDKKIGKLKDIAIGRCRERIEQAACKAKELMNKPLPEGQKKSDIYYNNKSSGITSIFKKRHGL